MFGNSSKLDADRLLNLVFHCVGNEQSLLECSSTTIDQCSSKVTVTCGGIILLHIIYTLIIHYC